MSTPPANDSSVSALGIDEELHVCPSCGLPQKRIELRPHETSRCLRCDHVLARTLPTQHRATLAWTVTGLVLALPSLLLPLATVDQLASHHDGLLLSSTSTLALSMPLLALLVLFCAVIAPILLLITITIILYPLVFGIPSPRLLPLLRIVHHCQEWSMPEVQLLAVLVAFIKLGSLVEAHITAGLWCYAAMSLTLIVASRRFVPDDIATRIVEAQRRSG